MQKYLAAFTVSLVLTIALPRLQAQTSGNAGTIDVHVVAPGSASPVGLAVVLSLVIPDDLNASPRVFVSLTDASGRVNFKNLALGVYNVCVQPQHVAFVDSCRWSAPDRVQLKNQHLNDIVNITLSEGVPIDIRVDDPSQRLATAEALLVQILTPVGYQPLGLWAKDQGGHNYRIIAPRNVAAKIRIDAGRLAVFDSAGLPPDSSGHISQFTAVESDTSKFFRFTVRDGK
jgi:hypothetical protein